MDLVSQTENKPLPFKANPTTHPTADHQPKKLKYYSAKDAETLPALQSLSPDLRHGLKVVSQVLPFRINDYVIDDLIDWDDVPNDPIYRLTFLHEDMLTPGQFRELESAIGTPLLGEVVMKVRNELNPHPAGQLSHNVPHLNGEPVAGIQHKYRETALMFPSAGQSCFTYCSFCFRWPQFVAQKEWKFATDRERRDLDYLREQKDLTDVLVTGGDPLTMRARFLANFIEPLLEPEYEHIKTLRIGTKVLSFWPYRFFSDPDSEDLLRLFERVTASGKHLAFMAHFNHDRELSTPAVQRAIARIRSTGAVIRSQGPLLRGINDDPQVWSDMWRAQVNLGIIPYYMFVERDTGPKEYFQVPLFQAHQIYSQAYQTVSGLARTVRGPSMSAFPGKVCVEGVTEISGERVFVLKFLQARQAEWCNRPFFAAYDESAAWLTDLKPALGETSFWWEAAD